MLLPLQRAASSAASFVNGLTQIGGIERFWNHLAKTGRYLAVFSMADAKTPVLAFIPSSYDSECRRGINSFAPDALPDRCFSEPRDDRCWNPCKAKCVGSMARSVSNFDSSRTNCLYPASTQFQSFILPLNQVICRFAYCRVDTTV